MSDIEYNIDEISLQIGMINCFAEMVACGVKKMAISPPIAPEHLEIIRAASDKIVQGFDIQSFLESSLMITDLQSEDFTKGKYSIIYYENDEIIKKYFSLKEKKSMLEKQEKYSEKERKEISREFCRLLSYPEHKIDEKINREIPKDPFIIV